MASVSRRWPPLCSRVAHFSVHCVPGVRRCVKCEALNIQGFQECALPSEQSGPGIRPTTSWIALRYCFGVHSGVYMLRGRQVCKLRFSDMREAEGMGQILKSSA